jgi:hypothetical protein
MLEKLREKVGGDADVEVENYEKHFDPDINIRHDRRRISPTETIDVYVLSGRPRL